MHSNLAGDLKFVELASYFGLINSAIKPLVSFNV